MNQYTSLVAKFNKPKTFITFIYVLPILILFVFIKSFSVNVPVGDDWALLPFFDSLKSGTANFEIFFSQHNEHRIFFPRIIFAILAFSSGWNINVEIWFSFIISIVSFIFISSFNMNFCSKKYLSVEFPKYPLVNIYTCQLLQLHLVASYFFLQFRWRIGCGDFRLLGL